MDSNEESNRTVRLPRGEVGSPYTFYHARPVPVNPHLQNVSKL